MNKNKTAAMDLLHGKRNHHVLIESLMSLPKFESFDDLVFIVLRFPSAWLLKLAARALIMTLIIVSLPWLNGKTSGLTLNAGRVSHTVSMGYHEHRIPRNILSILDGILPVLFRDFANEGLIKTGDKMAVVIDGVSDEDREIYKSGVISDYNMDVVSSMDSDRISKTYDFLFFRDFDSSSKLIDRALKKDGVVAFLLGDSSLLPPSDYKIVYLRRFDSTAVALKKLRNRAVAPPGVLPESTIGWRLLGLTPEVKKKALNKLEDVLLEPPRAASGKSTSYRKKTRFLPDLAGVPLETYPRRLFIDVGSSNNRAGGDSTWFLKNYPTQNTEFEMIKVETVVSSEDKDTRKDEVGMSEWLRRNVEEREFVVMKAEAEVVEELARSKAIGLVDELFLECKHRGIKKSAQRSRRAYWECLALYGRLRDEGVAVHQWWG